MARSNESHRVESSFKARPEDGPGGDFEGRGEYGNGRREGQGYEEGWDASGRVAGFVARNPYKTVLTSFGIGFGFGLFVTLLVSRRETSWFERYAPEAIQDLPDRLKHLPDRLKKVPESVASYVPSSWMHW